MSAKDKAKAIVLIEKLRLIESEIFRFGIKYGVKTVEDLDRLISKGKLTEQEVGEDLFVFDYLMSEKKIIEKKLRDLSINKSDIWRNLQNLLGLPKLSFRI